MRLLSSSKCLSKDAICVCPRRKRVESTRSDKHHVTLCLGEAFRRGKRTPPSAAACGLRRWLMTTPTDPWALANRGRADVRRVRCGCREIYIGRTEADRGKVIGTLQLSKPATRIRRVSSWLPYGSLLWLVEGRCGIRPLVVTGSVGRPNERRHITSRPFRKIPFALRLRF